MRSKARGRCPRPSVNCRRAQSVRSARRPSFQAAARRCCGRQWRSYPRGARQRGKRAFPASRICRCCRADCPISAIRACRPPSQGRACRCPTARASDLLPRDARHILRRSATPSPRGREALFLPRYFPWLPLKPPQDRLSAFSCAATGARGPRRIPQPCRQAPLCRADRHS
ncbi:unknown [Anaerotruncus sp. CAG:390]|nr:unknown [Anaerotruncus sp. CAG:390]